MTARVPGHGCDPSLSNEKHPAATVLNRRRPGQMLGSCSASLFVSVVSSNELNHGGGGGGGEGGGEGLGGDEGGGGEGEGGGGAGWSGGGLGLGGRPGGR